MNPMLYPFSAMPAELGESGPTWRPALDEDVLVFLHGRSRCLDGGHLDKAIGQQHQEDSCRRRDVPFVCPPLDGTQTNAKQFCCLTLV